MRRPTAKSDVLGLSSSLLCLVHCLALPVLVSFSAIVPVDGLHRLDWLFAVLALIAAIGTTRRSHDFRVRLMLWVGLALFCGGIALEQFDWWALPTYSAPHLLGSLLMIAGHVRSLRVGVCRIPDHAHA